MKAPTRLASKIVKVLEKRGAGEQCALSPRLLSTSAAKQRLRVHRGIDAFGEFPPASQGWAAHG